MWNSLSCGGMFYAALIASSAARAVGRTEPHSMMAVCLISQSTWPTCWRWIKGQCGVLLDMTPFGDIQSLGLVHLEPAVLRLPAIVGLLRDPVPVGAIRDGFTTPGQACSFRA